MNQFHGSARTARSGGPWKTDAVRDFVDLNTGDVAEDDAVAFVAERSDERADGGNAEGRLHCGRVLRDDEVAVGDDFRSSRKSEIDTAGEPPAGEIHVGGRSVVQFDEFERNGFVFRIVMDLVDDDIR